MTHEPTSAARKAYGSHVSGVLSRAGFARGDSGRDGYRALGERQSWERGYLDDPVSGQATVQHLTAGPASNEDRAERLDAYAIALDLAGFDVETRISDRLDGEPFLLVSRVSR